ncbi:hypothetical protein GO986_18025 [Deinococcus sp. HMF7620]|uniref:Uncharacterized protein n=1 Tax=Deinococcus arboris TaxID=2682977 RepID=A0A7C9LP78_9DEIO|nr:hypothetical protein [Deinococcus arboris]MVN88637.1 hypothetical protein [Deinococcus arboris]
MRPSENVKILLENIGREVHAELSGAGAIAEWRAPIVRAVTTNDLGPWMIFTIVGPLDDKDLVADLGQTAQISALILVNATFEISETNAHYLSTFDARVGIVRAIQRVLREAPPQLTTIWRGEEEAEVKGCTLSQSQVVIQWNEPA